MARATIALMALLIAPYAVALDTDGDGMSDALEETLGTDPAFAEILTKVGESPAYEPTEKRAARYDVREVHFASVAQGRWLWRIDFAVPYSYDNTIIILYVDADNDRATGRSGMGCETTYGHHRGRSTQMFYLPEDRRPEFPIARVATDDRSFYICADLPLKQEDGRTRFRMSILSEQADPHESRDGLGWLDVDAPGESERARVVTFADLRENEGFEVTDSAELLWKIQDDPANVIINSYRDCDYEGFEYYHSEYRWPALRNSGGAGSIKATVPKAGRFWPGVVVYDGSGPEPFEMLLDGEALGRFVAQADTCRQRLFFASDPVDLAAGQVLQLRAPAAPGSFIVEDIVLLAERPPVLSPPREIRDLEIAYDWASGHMRATWWTTWPVACEIRCGETVITEETPSQNHRILLEDLPEGTRSTCTVSALEGGSGEPVELSRAFTAGRPQVAPGSIDRRTIDMTLQAVGESIPAGTPLTTGVPFARGQLSSTDNIALRGLDAEWPLQARALINWPDGSVKVALIDTVTPETVAPGARLALTYGNRVSREQPADGIEIAADNDRVTVTTPSLKCEFDAAQSGLFTRLWADETGQFGDDTLITREDAPPRAVIVDADGNAFDTLGPAESITIEESGPLRVVVRVDGHHAAPTGRFFTYQVRFTFHARTPGVRVSYRWGNDESADEFAKFRSLRAELPLNLPDDARFLLGADENLAGVVSGAARLEQLNDDRYEMGEQSGEHAPGWIWAGGGDRAVSLFCRQFRQLYPKAIGMDAGTLYLDICPELPADQYADCSELDLIKLYYYLQDGVYKVRQGMTRTHELWLGLGAGVQEGAPASLADALNARAELINAPAVLCADPAYVSSTGVFGDFVPRAEGRTPRYDEVCDRVYRGVINHRTGVREYGMLNFGDQFGERRVNWSNGEYDHHHSAAQMFVRSADPGWYHLMLDMARHDIDVDLCHYHTSSRYRGASWIHAMGHSGRYFTKQYDGQWGIPAGGVTPSHTWCEGTCEYYMLTGDPSAIEAARSIADHYGGTYINNYDFTNGRIPGWQLIFTMAVYRATHDPFYLNAARIIVERVLERRTPGSGWERQLVPGHCHCRPRCRGCCSFMQGILGVGLREYYLATRDPRIPPAVVDGARYAIEQLWVPEQEAFRYTSCPHSSVTTSRSDTLAGLLLFAYECSGDEYFLDIVERGMNLGFESLGSLAHVRWTPYIIHALDRIRAEGPAIGGEKGATLCLRNDRSRPFEVRLYTRDGVPASKADATLFAPDGSTFISGDAGRILVQTGLVGTYTLTVAPDTGPWIVTCSVNPIVLSLAQGADLAVAGTPAHLSFEGIPGKPMSVSVEPAEGDLRPVLTAPSGAPCELRVPTADEGIYRLTLTGPGRARIRAEGAAWASLLRGRYFNASAPEVRIEGGTTLLPGQGRTVKLSAVARDFEDDIASITWELPDGRKIEGEQISFDPPADVTRLQVRAIVLDASGNTGQSTAEVRLPPVAIADAQGVVTIQAEDFTGQGKGEVLVTDRIGNVGKMITRWHADIGHWLEWQFSVPEDGEYLMFARYATDCAESTRRLTIDGAVPGEGYGEVCFKCTGGYCTAADNWEIKQLGRPVTLKAGLHSLRMENLGEGLALDALSIAPRREAR